MKKKELILSLLILSTLLWSCSSSDSNLVYAYQDRIVDTLSVIAAEKELFAKNVEGKIFSSGPQTVEALISGSADVAAMGDSAAIILLSKYDNFRIIASHGSGEKRHRIVTGKEIQIDTWNDLQGLRIGIKKGTSTYGGLIIKAEDKGIDLENSLMEMSPSVQLTALASGEIDALVASEPTPSIAEDKEIGRHFDYLDMPGMTYPIVLVASEKTIAERKAQLEDLIKSLENAQDYLATNRSDVITVHSSLSGFSPAMVENSLSLHNHVVRPASDFRETLDELGRILLKTGTINQLPDWDKVLDMSLME
ncbi:ABC transporter substrate-binding protein [Spirochaeta isovalerica]|uniref:ABC-type nitrate/sulfonate/bicarbonate transport system substrate-binding protein n=1 Tax=Spirochaeta isovalerica TaxID=150 RepID=A0A841RF91_9SPIO|nr:PhnD/SsuA/transferrin family substrate-binding protein [Spirochaeta isovalerica]MBB6481258.1 ABC-type nitrate/sulfonate/bicarbonate transport system substrate-binding protein [Spirochaeta isovalerica]